jgi:hypothetical protein
MKNPALTQTILHAGFCRALKRDRKNR